MKILSISEDVKTDDGKFVRNPNKHRNNVRYVFRDSNMVNELENNFKGMKALCC